MRLIALHVYKWEDKDSKLLCTAMQLQDLWFYQRGIAKEHINFNSRTISGRVPEGKQASIILEQGIGVCHSWTSQDGISATAITDAEYPEKAAYSLLNKVIM
jgi:synaptobrevin homolog YKT6